jgi:hypothetical protein
VHALPRTPSPQPPAAEGAVGDLLFATRLHPMAEILPDNNRFDTFPTGNFIYHGLITLVVEVP